MTIPSAASPGQGRQIWRALAISLALHAWLLANGWPQAVPPRAAGALHATLRPLAAAPAPAQTAPMPELPPVAASRVAEHGRNAANTAAAPPPAVAAFASSTVAAADRSAAGVEPSAAGRPPAAASGASRASGVAGGQSGMAGDGADPDGLRQYRLALAREARRFKRYPERALLAGIGGTAEVRVEHAGGAVPVAWLARSSGDEALDAAALSMMREAAPRTLVPEPLRGRSFAVSLPVIFDASAE